MLGAASGAAEPPCLPPIKGHLSLLLRLRAESTHLLPFSTLALTVPQRDHKLISPGLQRVFQQAPQTSALPCQSVIVSPRHFAAAALGVREWVE